MTRSHQVAIIGAGFAGLAIGNQLLSQGISDFVLLERGPTVGGTWRDNTYPGAACDVPSHLYSLSFAPNPYWSQHYATQPEILRYLEDTYSDSGVIKHVELGSTVRGLTWDGDQRMWVIDVIETDPITARVVVTATGTFHTPNIPQLPGLEEFRGQVLHSARWDADVDLLNQRVAVIGTGASAIQLVPAIANDVQQLYLYQRSPAWILPKKNPAYSHEQQDEFAHEPELAYSHRAELYDRHERATTFLNGDPTAEAIALLARTFLGNSIPDEALRTQLTPDYPFGCKRVLISSDFYPSLLRDNVKTINSPITSVNHNSIVTEDGATREVSVIVLCTGFRASDYLLGIDVIGKHGANLHGQWAGRPHAHHGLAVPNFPNLFFMYGPNTNQGGNSILLILEAQAEFIADMIGRLSPVELAQLEVTREALDDYMHRLDSDLANTIWSDCHNYFQTADGHVVTQLPHTSGAYRQQLKTMPPEDFTWVEAQS